MKTSKTNSFRDKENELALQCVSFLSGVIWPEVLQMMFPQANLCVLNHVCVSVNARKQQIQLNKTSV